jgi:mRNA interferase RelE/StbE
MAYLVVFTPSAERSVAKLDVGVARRIKPKILTLADHPRPSGCLKLAGSRDLYRIRVGDYRIIYTIDDARQLIEITLVAHRREVYRDL